MMIADHQKRLHCQFLGFRPETLGILEMDDVSSHNATLSGSKQLWKSIEITFIKTLVERNPVFITHPSGLIKN